MTVVCNTSPITNLAAIDHLDLLLDRRSTLSKGIAASRGVDFYLAVALLFNLPLNRETSL